MCAGGKSNGGLTFDVAMVVFQCVITRLAELGLEVFCLCEHPIQLLHIETPDRELFDRTVGLVSQLQMLRFSARPDTSHQETLVRNIQWRADCGRYRMSADFNVPVTDANRDALNPEYVRIMGMIPTSEVPRTPIETDLAAMVNGDGYRPLPM